MNIEPEVISAIVALCGVVGLLWRLHLNTSKREQERLASCEELHKESQEKLIELTGNYHELRGRMDGVESLSTSVLTELKQIKAH